MTREEALEILDKKLKKMMTDYQEYLEHTGEPLKEHEKWLHALNMAIEALRERPKGRWVNGICTECGQVDFSKPNFCPNCGSDNRGEEE